MTRDQLTRPLAVAAIVAALLLGGALDVGKRLFGGGPDPETIASSSLQSMRAQQRLVPFVARFVSVTTSKQERFGLSAERTLILPGTVRYELDLAKLNPADLAWDASTKTLTVKLPDIEIAGPEVDLPASREYGQNQVLTALTGGEGRLDQANRTRAIADLRSQANAATPMRLAREAARSAIERSFAMPLQAAGVGEVKVVARFPQDGTGDPSYLDASRPVNEVLAEAEAKRRAGE